ncbi:MAG: endo-1,4-beta-xylanase [Nanoarchaeota archaeon]
MTLREAAERRDILIGTAVNVDVLKHNETYRNILQEEFNEITPENCMKMSFTQPNRGNFDFADADALVEFAEQNRMKVRGHTLAWHLQQPNWFTKINFSREEMSELLHNHVRVEAEHYRGKIYAWDVLNEAVLGDGSLRQNNYLNAMGQEYIEKIFRWAHEADNTARLFYNDYGCESINAKSDAIYNLLKRLLDRDVPLHGIGFQMHLNQIPNYPSIEKNMKRFSELGLEIHITEMDFQVYKIIGTNDQKLSKQADVYRRIMRMCLENPRCKAFVVWGISDCNYWMPEYNRHLDAPLLFDTNYKPKPAYYALLEELKKD